VKVGDFIEVYHHLPRYEAGNIPLGPMGKGIVVDVKKDEPPSPVFDTITAVSYLTTNGELKTDWINKEYGGIVVTVKILQEAIDDSI